MAKRRRLSPATALGGDIAAEADMGYPLGVAPTRTIHTPPVAQIAAEAAARAALDQLAGEMRAARDGGRMIVDLPLGAVAVDHLTRDRMHFGAEDMAALKASLSARGQQTPIEVVVLAGERYGLISGARRMAALQALLAETGEDRFARVQALIRPFADAPAAYLAMVEENEIRADLSFYERARLAAEAARLGLYDSPGAAVKALFVHAAPAKRSKILNFVALHHALGDTLRFPEAIPEKLGLALVRALEADPGFAARLRRALAEADPRDVAAERAVLDIAVTGPGPVPPPLSQGADGSGAETGVTGSGPSDRPADNVLSPVGVDDIDDQPAPGLRLRGGPGRVLLTGRAVTRDLLEDLAAWLATRDR